jgi:hypothetical protein
MSQVNESLSPDCAETIVDQVITDSPESVEAHEVLAGSIHDRNVQTPGDVLTIIDSVEQQFGLKDFRAVRREVVLRAAQAAFVKNLRYQPLHVQRAWRATAGSRQHH